MAPELWRTRGGDKWRGWGPELQHTLCPCRDGDPLCALPAAAWPNPTLTLQPCSNKAPFAKGTVPFPSLPPRAHLCTQRELLRSELGCSPC